MGGLLVSEVRKEVNSFLDFNEGVAEATQLLMSDADGEYELTFTKREKNRTLTQNKALHLYFKRIAEKLNDCGMSVTATMKTMDIPWTEILVKELMYKSVLKMMTDKQSTTEQTTIEVSEVVSVIELHLANKGVDVKFPDRFG